ncbi:MULTISPECIES: response regulator [unclassified Pseudodesulfovibrio]|uniref:response regulator n=1 Tax=unclassified Pseudodesulfovibrio TaxID=2661612 RepID=UPI000FEBDBD1|nr:MULTISPECIES: response regulator [unclassified Pseudodesulfovibrio]MCJ2164506.1 response regulator [Pseudodesulfovibrio sp. S3-i]RWU04704.1 response regulator [Pseudodesulfovibrio sp. S3]
MAPIRTLLVDDEDSFRSTLGKRLTRRGVIVEQAGSGEEALEKLEEFQPDVILLDVKMPGMDGLTALRKIKSASPQVEVVMLTGHANMEIAIEGMELGAFDYLMKPVEFEELLYKLEDAFTRKKRLEERLAAKTNSQ